MKHKHQCPKCRMLTDCRDLACGNMFNGGIGNYRIHHNCVKPEEGYHGGNVRE